MTRKILAVDLDGTLFNDNKDIAKENLQAITRMLDAGHILAIDTGRPNHVMKKLLKRFGIFEHENIYLLGYQGTVGMRSTEDTILFGQYLQNEPARRLLRYAIESGNSTLAFEYGNIYSFWESYDVENYRDLSKEPVAIIDDPDELIGHNLTKIMVINYKNHELLYDFQDAHEAELSQYFESMFSDVAFLEYIDKDANKGAGLMQLAEFLDIPVSDTVAVGDERNDISMINAASTGIAVLNARDELKAVADYITTVDNNHGAVAEVINKFILNDKSC